MSDQRPPLHAALDIARGLTHSTFTAAKAAELVRLLERVPAPEAALSMTRDVLPDEIDEDPPAELVTHPAISDAFQRGYQAGQHDAFEQLAGPAPSAGGEGPAPAEGKTEQSPEADPTPSKKKAKS